MPVKFVPSRFKYSNWFQAAPKGSKKGPVRTVSLALNRSSIWRVAKSCGNEPVKKVKAMSMLRRPVAMPIEDGTFPMNSLLFRNRFSVKYQ